MASKAPNQIGSLFAWFDASQITGKSDGDAITTWTNSEGTSARDVTQATPGKRPLYKTAILNSKPVVRFDGADDELKMATLTLNQPVSVYVVAQMRGAYSANKTIFDGDAVNSCRLYWFSSTQLGMYAGGSVAPQITVAMSNAFHLLECLYSGAASAIRADGSAATTANTGTAAPGGFTLGGLGGGSGSNAPVDIAEIALFTAALSTADRQALERYFAAKYALSVSTNA